MKNRRFIITQVAVAAIALLLTWLVVRNIDWREVIATFRTITWPWIVAIAAVTTLMHIFACARWWFLLWGFGYKLPFWRTVSYRTTAYTLSYVTPGPQLGGEVLMVYYPNKNHGVPSAAAIAAASVDKSLEFLGNFTFIAVGIIVMLIGQRIVSGADLYAMVLVSSLMLVPMVLLIFVARGRHPISAIVSGARRIIPLGLRSWSRRTFKSMPSLEHMHGIVFHSEDLMAWLWHHRLSSVIMATLITVLSLILVAVDFWLIAGAIGMDLTKTQTIGTMVMVYFAYLLPVPGGLGAIEAAVVLAFNTFGYTTEQALSVAIIMRVRDTILAGVGFALGGFDSLRSAVATANATPESLLGNDGSMSLEEAEGIITGHPAKPDMAPPTAVMLSTSNGRNTNGMDAPQTVGSPTAVPTVVPTALPSVVTSSEGSHRADEGQRSKNP